MIDHVQPNERITAGKTNQIIDRVNGLQTPSDRFVNTPNGTLTPTPDYTSTYSYFPVPEHILQTKRGPSLEMVYRGGTRAEDRYGENQKMAWFCYLGPNTATLKSKASPYDDPDSIWLGSDNSQLFKEITDEMIASLSAVGNWVDVGAYDDKSVKVSIVKISKDEQSQQQLPEKYAVVICGGGLDSFDQLLEDNKYQMYDKTEEVGKHSYTIAAADNRERVFQLGFGPDVSDDEADFPVVDSQVSALELSSLAEKTYTDATLSMDFTYRQLYNFDLAGTLSPSDISSGGIEVVVRDSHTTGGNGARINYVDLSTITESLSGGPSISGDHDVIPGFSNSIDTQKDSRGTYHQLYGFENPTVKNFYQLMDGKYQFVIRDYNSQDKYVVYSDISSFVNNLTISGDANIPATKSISLVSQAANKFYQLYNWQGYNHTPMVAEIEADGQVHYINEVNGAPGPKHLLFEDHQTGELEYHALGIKIPPPELSSIGGGDEIIQNITILSADLSALSADLSALDNFWVKGEDSQENYGSSIGDSSKTTVINLDTKRLNGTWYTDNGDMNVGGTCSANKLQTGTVLQIGGTTLNETQLQQLLRLI